MSMINPSTDQRVRDALEEELQRRSRELQHLLLESRQIDGFLGIAQSVELRALLERRQAEIGLSTLRCLAEWYRVGGEFRLSAPRGIGESSRMQTPRPAAGGRLDTPREPPRTTARALEPRASVRPDAAGRSMLPFDPIPPEPVEPWPPETPGLDASEDCAHETVLPNRERPTAETRHRTAEPLPAREERSFRAEPARLEGAAPEPMRPELHRPDLNRPDPGRGLAHRSDLHRTEPGRMVTPLPAHTPAETPPDVGDPPTEESVGRLADHFLTRPEYKDPASADWRTELMIVLAALQPAVDDDVESEKVYRGIRECDRWRVLPRDVQRGLVGMCAARLRRLQDERGYAGVRIEEGFSRLSAYSKREQPGFVFGLSRNHRPLRETWEEDAEAIWDRLYASAPIPVAAAPNHERLLVEVERLAPEVEAAPAEAKEAVLGQLRRAVKEALKGGVSARDPRLLRHCAGVAELLDAPEFRALRKHIRAYRKDESDERVEEKEPGSIVPADWRWWTRTRGRRAILIGGEPREPNRVRLRDAFGFAELEWEPAEHRRNALIAVRDRVRGGKIDLVVLLGAFIGHDADEIILPACRERGIDWVHVDKGYGIVRLRRSIERFLDPGGEIGEVSP